MEQNPDHPGNVIATRGNNGVIETVYLDERTAAYFVGDTEILVDVSFKDMFKCIKKLTK